MGCVGCFFFRKKEKPEKNDDDDDDDDDDDFWNNHFLGGFTGPSHRSQQVPGVTPKGGIKHTIGTHKMYVWIPL